MDDAIGIIVVVGGTAASTATVTAASTMAAIAVFNELKVEKPLAVHFAILAFSAFLFCFVAFFSTPCIMHTSDGDDSGVSKKPIIWAEVLMLLLDDRKGCRQKTQNKKKI